MIQDHRKLKLFKSSAPLCRLDRSRQPISAASGTLVNFKGNHLLLTVEHATGNFGDWAVQIQYEPERGTKLYRLGAMNFLRAGNIRTGETRIVDFAYVDVPKDLQPIKQEINDSMEITGSVPVDIHEIEFPCKPSTVESYGFSGFIKSSLEHHPFKVIFASEAQVYDGLTYIETRDGDNLVFSMPNAHLGHIEFQGCSGSPLMDTSGKIVGLLTGGCEERNEIYGLSLESYRSILELHSSGLL